MTVSCRYDKRYCIKHNSRDLISSNVIPERCQFNTNYLTPNSYDKDGNRFCSIEEIYDKVFQPHWEAFQSRQSPYRKCDKTYLEYIRDKKYAPNADKKSPSEAFELIFQVGSVNTINNEEIAKNCVTLLDDYFKDFTNRDYVCTITEKEISDPNWRPPFDYGLILIDAHIHVDEKGDGHRYSPHLHMVVIPYAKMSRGALYQASIGRCFAGLGYDTKFKEQTDKYGNKIPCRDKEGNIKTDGKGNTIYKTHPIEKGIVSWIADEKEKIQKNMKEKLGWERDYQSDGRKTYLEISDYRVYRSRQRGKELQENIKNAEIDAFSKIISVIEKQEKITTELADEISKKAFSNISYDDTFTLLNYLSNLPTKEREKILADIRMSNVSEIVLENEKRDLEKTLMSATIKNLTETVGDKEIIKTAWEEYRQRSNEFWGWYHDQKKIQDEKVMEKNSEMQFYSSARNTADMLFYSENLILSILGLLLSLYLKRKEEKLLDEMKVLISERNKLSSLAKDFSSEQYNERNDITIVMAQKALLKSLKKAQSSLEKNIENNSELRAISL